MDGVLVDSEAFICKAAILMFMELNVNATPEDFQPFLGMGENKYLGGVANKHSKVIDIDKVKARTYKIYEDLVRGNLYPLPGAHEFISLCRKKAFKLALATSADRIKMVVSLKEIGLAEDTFHSIVTGLDVENKKPFPDIYVQAAKNIGLEPYECLVIEDAISGIKAAKAAGCRCLAVTSSFDASVLQQADWICDSLLSVPEEAINW